MLEPGRSSRAFHSENSKGAQTAPAELQLYPFAVDCYTLWTHLISTEAVKGAFGLPAFDRHTLALILEGGSCV